MNMFLCYNKISLTKTPLVYKQTRKGGKSNYFVKNKQDVILRFQKSLHRDHDVNVDNCIRNECSNHSIGDSEKSSIVNREKVTTISYFC
jgi:hypothetical protein